MSDEWCIPGCRSWYRLRRSAPGCWVRNEIAYFNCPSSIRSRVGHQTRVIRRDGNATWQGHKCAAELMKVWSSRGRNDGLVLRLHATAVTSRFGIMVADRSAMKLSAKFARQESEEARLARIRRRHVPSDRADAIRRMLSISEPPAKSPRRVSRTAGSGEVLCHDCKRAFALPMHLSRHRKTKHGNTAASNER